MTENKIKLFESQQIRTEWDEEKEKWWFSVLDVIAVLTEQPDYKKVRNYWKWLKNKLIAEGSQLVSGTNQLKLVAADWKRYKTDVVDTEQILRLIQSIPSKKPSLSSSGWQKSAVNGWISCKIRNYPSSRPCTITSAWAIRTTGLISV